MERGRLEMSEKERKRLGIMPRVKQGEMTIREGSKVLKISLPGCHQPTTIQAPVPHSEKTYVPSQDHPWRKFNPIYLERKKEVLV